MSVALIILLVAVVMICSSNKCSCPKEEVLDRENDVPTYFG